MLANQSIAFEFIAEPTGSVQKTIIFREPAQANFALASSKSEIARKVIYNSYHLSAKMRTR